MGSTGSDKFLRKLTDEAVVLNYRGNLGVHFFTFGGMAKTADWAQDFKHNL
jgi:methylenetetrahydrofolate reductase (NADPH)